MNFSRCFDVFIDLVQLIHFLLLSLCNINTFPSVQSGIIFAKLYILLYVICNILSAVLTLLYLLCYIYSAIFTLLYLLCYIYYCIYSVILFLFILLISSKNKISLHSFFGCLHFTMVDLLLVPRWLQIKQSPI